MPPGGKHGGIADGAEPLRQFGPKWRGVGQEQPRHRRPVIGAGDGEGQRRGGGQVDFVVIPVALRLKIPGYLQAGGQAQGTGFTVIGFGFHAVRDGTQIGQPQRIGTVAAQLGGIAAGRQRQPQRQSAGSRLPSADLCAVAIAEIEVLQALHAPQFPQLARHGDGKADMARIIRAKGAAQRLTRFQQAGEVGLVIRFALGILRSRMQADHIIHGNRAVARDFQPVSAGRQGQSGAVKLPCSQIGGQNPDVVALQGQIGRAIFGQSQGQIKHPGLIQHHRIDIAVRSRQKCAAKLAPLGRQGAKQGIARLDLVITGGVRQQADADQDEGQQAIQPGPRVDIHAGGFERRQREQAACTGICPFKAGVDIGPRRGENL